MIHRMGPRRTRWVLDGVVLVGFTVAILLLGAPWLNYDGRRVTGLAIPVLGVVAFGLVMIPGSRDRFDLGSMWRASLVLAATAWATIALIVANAQHEAASVLDDGPRRLFQFAALFAVSAAATELAVRRRAIRGLPFLGLVVAVVTWLLFWRLTKQSDVSIPDGLGDAIEQRDPQPIFSVFRRAYLRSGIGFLEGATASLRHVTVRGGIVASFVALATLPQLSRGWGRWLAWVGIWMGALVALVTLSRTNLAVVLVVLGLVGVRVITWKQPRLAIPIAAVSSLLVGVVCVIGFQFIDRSTNSGEQRFERVKYAVEHLDDGFVSGLDQVVDGEFVQSPHNTVLDLWLGGGIMAGLAGLVLLALVGWWTTQAAVGTMRASTVRELQLQAATFGLFVVALARILAGGGGLLDPVAWFGLGVGVVLLGLPERLPDFRPPSAAPASFGDQPHIVLTMVSPLAYGAGRVVCEYAGALQESGHRVTVAYDHDDAGSAIDRPTVVAELAGLGVESVRIPGLSSPRALRPGGRVERAVADLGPDLLVATQLRNAGPTVSLSGRIGVESIVLVQNLPRFGGSRPVQLVKRTIYGRALTGASLVICVAQQVADELSQHYGVEDERLAVVSNGIDPGPEPLRRRADRHEIRSEFGVEEGHHLFVNIGRMHPQKGHVHLIEAARRLRERAGVGPFTVIVVGGAESGATERLGTQLKDQVEQLGLSDRVRFAGYRTDTRDLLECADAFVLSSLWEGGPSLAALEAMAAECPVVLTDYGSRLEGFVDGEHGFYVPAGDPEAMAEALHEIMGTADDDLIAMGEAARAYVVEHRSLDRARRSFVARLDQLLQAAP